MEDELVYMTVYCSTTGLFNEDEMNKDNLTDIAFPRFIVKEWFDQCGDEKDCTFDEWLTEEYTADSTDGLYQFALDRGFRGVRLDWEEK